MYVHLYAAMGHVHRLKFMGSVIVHFAESNDPYYNFLCMRWCHEWAIALLKGALSVWHDWGKPSTIGIMCLTTRALDACYDLQKMVSHKMGHFETWQPKCHHEQIKILFNFSACQELDRFNPEFEPTHFQVFSWFF